MKTKWLLMLVAAALFALSGLAGAAEVTINNAGFESPPLGEGGWNYVADGWTSTSAGVWNPGGSWPAYPNPQSNQIPEGQQVAWVDAGELTQVLLAETLTADTTYTLSVQVGNNWYYNSGDYVIELRAGGTVLADFGENAESNITDDTFELRTVTYAYDPADAALLDEPLEIRLAVDGAEVDFDDVKLDATQCYSMTHSPANGDTVSPASDRLLSWTNRAPNVGSDVWVDVWFGTDPNSGGGPNYDRVLHLGENETEVEVDTSVDGTYYWQVDSYLDGSPTGDPYESCVFFFHVLSDIPVTVDAGVNMITWSGQPVPLDPTVVDDHPEDLVYHWTATPADGVSFNPNEFIEDPTVTIDKSGLFTSLVVNPGFENPALDDNKRITAAVVPGWSEGYYTGDGTTWEPYNGYCGVIDPNAAYGYGGVAPEGENIAWCRTYAGDDDGISQTLPVVLQADTQYDLSVLVGTPGGVSTPASWRIELLAGDVKVKDTPGIAPASNNWIPASLTFNPGASHAQLGQPLMIRLIATDDNGTSEVEVNFDDVQLTATPAYPFPAVHTVTLTLVASDKVASATDTVEIDVYDDECAAARIGLGLAAENPGDIDEDCDTDLKDLYAMLLTWLNEPVLTVPLVKP